MRNLCSDVPRKVPRRPLSGTRAHRSTGLSGALPARSPSVTPARVRGGCGGDRSEGVTPGTVRDGPRVRNLVRTATQFSPIGDTTPPTFATLRSGSGCLGDAPEGLDACSTRVRRELGAIPPSLPEITLRQSAPDVNNFVVTPTPARVTAPHGGVARSGEPGGGRLLTVTRGLRERPRGGARRGGREPRHGPDPRPAPSSVPRRPRTLAQDRHGRDTGLDPGPGRSSPG